MRRSTALVITIAAAAVFTTPLLLFLAGGRSDPSLENRALAETPELSPGRLLDSSFYREISAYFVDRVPLRDLGVRADAWIDFHVLGDTPNQRDVAIGADGWLFNPETYTAVCSDALPSPEAVVSGADLLMSVLAASGRDVAFTISPQKWTVYPERLGDLAPLAACAQGHATELRDALLTDPPEGYVDTWGVLLAAAQDGESVYFRDDTHWNYLGAAMGAEAIVEHLWPGWWSDDDLVFGPPEERAGNLARQMSLSITETHTPVWVERDGVTVDSSKQRVAKNTPKVELIESTLADGAEVPGGLTVVLGDSFMEFTMEEHLAPYTRSLVAVNWRAIGRSGSLANPGGRPVLNAEDYLLDRIAEADAVIVQTVEWESWQRLTSMRLTSLLVDRLSDGLPHEDVAATDITVLPGDEGDAAGRRFLIVRGGEGRFTVELLHRDDPAADWEEIGSTASLRDGLAVVDLRDAPAGGEVAVRLKRLDPASVTLLRLVTI
ncbi:MAG: hypothetical protein KQH83_09430 [Actinobacteria bacterium]|nr:hypothetical protein [Actinomycetota bacterium]